jgi:HEAT repeat protein
MKKWTLISLILCASVAPADPPETIVRLEAALKEASTFEYGKNDGPMKTVSDLVVAAAKDAALRPLAEQKLLAALAAQGSRDFKENICRQLVMVASPASIKKLEPMLSDAKLAHIARYTLTRIESPDAPAALLRALPKTTGLLQAGIINSLGNRRYAPALPEIGKLASSSDTVIASAAIAALGEIGGAEAIKTLQSLKASPQVNDALLACAERLTGQQAAAVYEKLYASANPRTIRIAALRGLAISKAAAAGDVLIPAIKADDAALSAAAIGFTRLAKGESLTKSLVELMPAIPPAQQERLIRAIGDRDDATAKQAVLTAVKSEDAKVRAAALEVLGNTGDASAVPILAAAAAKGGDDQRAARESLLKLRDAKTNTAILAAASSTEGKLKAELLRALAGRKPKGAAEVMFKHATDADADVRKEAIAGLGETAAESDITALMQLLKTPKDKADRGNLEGAISSTFRRLGEPEKRADLLMSELKTAPADVKPSIVKIFKAVPSPAALAMLRDASKSDDKDLADAAVRTLGEWPDQTAAEDLAKLAATAESNTHKVLALRGYIRLAGSAKEPLPMFTRAIDLAQRPDERKLILSGLSNVGNDAALKLVMGFSKDEALLAEVTSAVVQIAGKLKDKPAAKKALEEVLAVIKDEKQIKQAREALEALTPKKAEEQKPKPAEKPAK